MQLEPVETRRVTGAARSSISLCTIRGRTANTSAAECFATSGVASCSRLPSSQEIHKTTTDRDYYVNLCSAGSLQQLGAQCDPRNPVHPR
ncbi:hypothetical protein ATANTOWER_007982 [Ataeniobius toweri]|uniref:Uncharacterized protein n=1 Tax=Ataeniobius toweri TaxID=208326 RepID=A0ABU7AK29_9TELE|nr:hypothetical protein [Ataeniobius toweri]